ncbi:MAG: hypothetical protein WC314_17700 [Vulcanimicrobiota bacterium]
MMVKRRENAPKTSSPSVRSSTRKRAYQLAFDHHDLLARHPGARLQLRAQHHRTGGSS